MKQRLALLAVIMVFQGGVSCSTDGQTLSHGASADINMANYSRAAEYSRQHSGEAMLVMSNGRILFENYANHAAPNQPHRLASASKTFWGLLAVAAAQDGFLKLDEPVSDTLTEWRSDPRKSRITVRQLLNFTSGLDPAVQALQGNPRSGDKFRQVIAIPAIAEPGATFAYGPSHLFAFGAWLERKLQAAGRETDPLAYLHERILDPIGLNIGHWQRDAVGHPIMPAGAHVAPREWIKLGQLIVNDGQWQGRPLIEKAYLRQMFSGSSANPAYGLTIWLNREVSGEQGYAVADGNRARRIEQSDDGFIYRDGPADLAMAAGQGKQRLYLIPSQKLVVLRFGESKGRGWVDSEFLSLALAGRATSAPATLNSNILQTSSNWRQICAPDIERICPSANGNMRALRLCYRRFRPEFSMECQQAVSTMTVK